MLGLLPVSLAFIGKLSNGNGRKAGRPDEGKNTDRWGNRPNENNWKKFNQTH